MLFKANLHFHTADDPRDPIPYSLEEGMDAARRLGFEVLALSCHDCLISLERYCDYAASRGVLLISGVERHIEGKHVVVLNADPSIEHICTFPELKRYKATHPEIFILAPHPYYPGDSSLMELLEPHLELFDAIEQSWFYSKRFNIFNRKAQRIAEQYHLPFLSTSDTHDLRWLDLNYAVINAEEKTPAALFRALREGRFENHTSPRSFVREILPLAGRILVERAFRFVSGRRKTTPVRRPA